MADRVEEAEVAQIVDANVTWATLTTTFGPPDLERDPVWVDRLFAANNNGDTNNAGVRVSFDGGVTWSDALIGWTSTISAVRR